MAYPNPPFPPALVIPPLTPPHKQTIILLHGRGSSASKFGPELLNTKLPRPDPDLDRNQNPDARTTTLSTAFPHARFVFPTAPRRRATIYKRSVINQWFDCWHIELLAGDEDDETTQARSQDWLMIEGLQQTTAYLHELLRAEVALVPGGARGVVLGGISQGCAASLVAMLLWDGEPLGGLVGMCGWLPFVKELVGVLERRGQADDGFDPFERENERAEGESEPSSPADPGVAAVRELGERLELDERAASVTCRTAVLSAPVFLGHGVEDEMVPLRLGKMSADCLEAIGLGVSFHTYPQLGHWYSSDMLGDMVGFLKASIDYHPK